MIRGDMLRIDVTRKKGCPVREYPHTLAALRVADQGDLRPFQVVNAFVWASNLCFSERSG